MKRFILLTSFSIFVRRSYTGMKIDSKQTRDFNSLKSPDFFWLSNKAAKFKVHSSQIKILHYPKEFYDILLEKCKLAQRRIVIVSLYLGTGALESNIVSAIHERLICKSDLKVKVLLDCTRGSRGETNSRTMLLPLLNSFSDSCKVSLYHTPHLRGLIRRLLPDRYNEVIGLQHMKLYIFDDDLIITGANLSHDYFTDRQDRYMVVSNCCQLTDFLEGLTDIVSQFSFQLDKNNQISIDPNWALHPADSDLKEFKSKAKMLVWNYYEKYIGKEEVNDDATDTIIYPLLEMGQLDLHQESCLTQELLASSSLPSEISIATAYFNITQAYLDAIVNESSAKFILLMAHPTANSFYNARWPLGGIPKGYSELAGRFLDKINSTNQRKRIELLEYVKKGWTFHGKGLWYSSKPSDPPSLTLIGSSNFGERSVVRDLECQFLIATSSTQLQQCLEKERHHLFQFGEPYTQVERDRRPPLWVRVVLYFFKTFL